MKKTLFLSFIFFVLGFLTHALLLPDFLSNGITDIRAIVVPDTQPITAATQVDPALTTITFDGSHFSRHNITVGFTRYVRIINTNQHQLMWLISTAPELQTSRGYGMSEAIKMQANKKGTIVVQDKNNRSENLVITVK